MEEGLKNEVQDSTLLSFRKVIASHLSLVLGEAYTIDKLLPLVQQNTGHRKAAHSVFSVVIKRLATLQTAFDDSLIDKCLLLSPETQTYIGCVRRTKDMLLFDPVPLRFIQLTIQNTGKEAANEPGAEAGDNTFEGSGSIHLGKRTRGSNKVVIVNGSKLQADENAYSCLRRTILTGFVARFLKKEINHRGSVKVITEYSHTAMNPNIKGLYRGLDLITDPSTTASASQMEHHLNIIKDAIRTNKDIQAQIDNNGAWAIDLTSRQLGIVKLFMKSKTDTATTMTSRDDESGSVMEEPTLVVKTLVSLAIQFSEHECDQYIWMVPDGRRQFVEQVLYLASMIFGDGSELGQHSENKQQQEEERSETKANRIGRKSISWIRAIKVLYFGVATGVDIWKSQNELSNGMIGIVEYTNMRMREIVVENRGRPGRGTGYGEDDDGDVDEDEEEQLLDEAELTRMATILSTSALAFASVGGKRIRKLNVDMSRIMDGKGNSGVFLQYVQSRLCGIERKSKAKFNIEADLSLVQAYPEALNLCLVIAEWHDTLSTLQESLDPYILVSHLFRLAAEIGQANRVLRVKDMESNVAEARWLLFWAARQVLEQGLSLLGLEFVERM